MIFDGITGARWTASSTPTSRPSPATRVIASADDVDDVAVEQDAAGISRS